MYKRICILLFIFIFLCSCNTANNKYQSEHGTLDNCLDGIDIVYKQDKNYKILSNEEHTIFHYLIRDDSGYIVDEGYHNQRGSFDIHQNGELLTMNYGYGGNVFYERYYDIANGTISRFFENPIASSNELVAYFIVKDSNKGIVLIIQNKFDPKIYYKEIVREFSDFVIKDIVEADFLENNTKIRISYWLKPNDEKVTEVIELGSIT